MLTRRKLLIASGLAGLLPAWRSWAQAPGKVWRIGVLEVTSMAMNVVNFDAFRRGLRELSYIEGKNLIDSARRKIARGRGDRMIRRWR